MSVRFETEDKKGTSMLADRTPTPKPPTTAVVAGSSASIVHALDHSPVSSPHLATSIILDHKHQMELVSLPSIPRERRLKTQFVKLEDTKSTDTFHVVYKAQCKTADEIRTFFIKENETGSQVSELEAAIAAHYRLLAPHFIANTYAIYDEDQKAYIGVASEAFPDFVTVDKEKGKIKPDDLDTKFIVDEKSIPIINKLDDELRLLESERETIKRKIAKIEEEEKTFSAKPDPLSTTSERNSEVIQKYVEEKEALSRKRASINSSEAENARRISGFFNRIELPPHSISAKQLNNFRIRKGLAIVFATAHVFKEFDLHGGQFSKYGFRMDFDESRCDIAIRYKNSKLTSVRAPTETTFAVLAEDFIHFPNLMKHATPFYWPTTQAPSVLAKHNYTLEENALFATLENDLVFRYFSNFIFAKYALSTPEMYHELTKYHMRVDCPSHTSGSLLIMDLLKDDEERIAQFRDVLVTVPQFSTFLKAFGEDVATELQNDLRDQGVQLTTSPVPSDSKTASTKLVRTATADPIRENLKQLLAKIKFIEKATTGVIKVQIDDAKAFATALANSKIDRFTLEFAKQTASEKAKVPDNKEDAANSFVIIQKLANEMIVKYPASNIFINWTVGFAFPNYEGNAASRIKACSDQVDPAKIGTLSALHKLLIQEQTALPKTCKLHESLNIMITLVEKILPKKEVTLAAVVVAPSKTSANQKL